MKIENIMFNNIWYVSTMYVYYVSFQYPCIAKVNKYSVLECKELYVSVVWCITHSKAFVKKKFHFPPNLYNTEYRQINSVVKQQLTFTRSCTGAKHINLEKNIFILWHYLSIYLFIHASVTHTNPHQTFVHFTSICIIKITLFFSFSICFFCLPRLCGKLKGCVRLLRRCKGWQ